MMDPFYWEKMLLRSFTQLPKLDLFQQGDPTQPSDSPLKKVPPELRDEQADNKAVETQKVIKEQREKAPAPQPVSGDVAAGGQMGGWGGLGAVLNPASATPGNNVRVPRNMVSDSDALRSAMLQTGLNLMVPQWGGPLAQLGMAVGGGAEAFQRSKALGDKDDTKDLARQKAQADIGESEARAEYYRESGESSKAKRLKEKTDRSTEFERLASNMGLGPKGSAYLKLKMKSFTDITDPDAELDDITRFQKYVEEAQALDAPAKKPLTNNETQTVQSTEIKPPNVGEVRAGYKFMGGDPSDRKNWEKVK